MWVSIHQPNYIPYPGFFNKIKESDLFVIYDTAQYVKGRWDNRNRIRDKQGSIFLTIPLKDKHSFRLSFRDVKLPIDNKWKKKHLKSIKICYAKSKYFDKYIDSLEKIYSRDFKDLVSFNTALIRFLMESLDIRTKTVFSSELNLSGDTKSTKALLDILNAVKSKSYISGPSGPNYLNMELFEELGIKVKLQKYSLDSYPQVYEDFIPNLSTLDLLFNMGSKSRNFI